MFVRYIAENRRAWEERVDPQNNDPGAFDRMTVDEKMRLIVELWPEDVKDQDSEGQAILTELRVKR